MFKKLTIILILLIFVFSTVPAYASNDHHMQNFNHTVSSNPVNFQTPVIYTKDIVVTKAGGVYQVGFTTIQFPKNFIDSSKLPITIHVEISSINGVPGIEFSPDIPSFNKDVIIHVDSYNKLLYDKTFCKNVKQHIRQQNLKVSHFSRYAFS